MNPNLGTGSNWVMSVTFRSLYIQ